MARNFILLGILLGCVHSSVQNFCMSNEAPENEFSPEGMPLTCQKVIQAQVQMELEASLTYLSMSAHFSNYGNYRPGVAKFFLENAIEERIHAKKLLHYMNMRGERIASDTIKSVNPKPVNLSTVEKAMESAIGLEKSVTSSIKNMIKICSGEGWSSENTVAQSLKLDAAKNIHNENDYQAVDYLTSEFLAEQITGTRKIVEHLSTLKRMRNFGQFAEVMFDKTLLAGHN